MKLGSLRSTFAALVFPILFCTSAAAQAQKEPPPQKSTSDISASDTQSQTSAQTDPKPSETEQKRTEPSKPMTPGDPRQAQLLADTQKLYQLTQELKAEVAKSNKDTLSIAVIKKAEEVEKLAKSLKERMKAAQ
jgi:hypothetical protein